MQRNGETVDIDVLLGELYEKKRWLDTVISGLETALDSPDHKFLESVKELFAGADGTPKVDLKKQKQARLAKLAGQVGKGRRGASRLDSLFTGPDAGESGEVRPEGY